MPATQFICPDGQRIDINQCISECRMAERCLTLPTLLKAAETREWDGTPHVTNLIGGTLQEWLQIKHDYAIDPKGTMYAQLGTAYHSMLEGFAQELEIPAEINFNRPGVIQGTADLLQPIPDSDGGVYDLIDYKTWGSYRIMKSLGIRKKKNPNHLGTDRRHADYWTYYQDPQSVDNRDTELQLNKYRIELEKDGYPIRYMFVQATCRDGGLQSAKNLGVVEQVYMIPINPIPDEVVEQFFTAKAAILRIHLESDSMPDICTQEERWNNDAKCRRYCDVAQFCPNGRNYVKVPVSAPSSEAEVIDI